MLEFNSVLFVNRIQELSRAIGELKVSLEISIVQLPVPIQDSHIFKILELVEKEISLPELSHFSDMPLFSTVVKRLVSNVKDGQLTTWNTFLVRLEYISQLARDELESKVFLVLTSEQVSWHKKSPQDHFGHDVYLRFVSVEYDMSAALKCFAYEQYTSCVMHLTKITEQGIRIFAETVIGASALTKANFTPNQWKQLYDQIASSVKAEVPASVDELKLKEARLIALDRFESIRLIRNESHHPDQDYSPEESRDYLTNLPTFLRQVVSVI
jgi:hypothetical protein